MLALFLVGVHLDPNWIRHFPEILCSPCNLLGVFQRTHGLDFAGHTDDFADFIGLKMADENPTDRKVFQGLAFEGELLRVILAERSLAPGKKCAEWVGAMSLADHQKRGRDAGARVLTDLAAHLVIAMLQFLLCLGFHPAVSSCPLFP
jgi:hypothetical protein